MKTYNDVKIYDSNYEISLTKITDLKIKDIRGYLTREFDEPVFKMTKVEFEDGSFLGCEGEHDLPYLTGYGNKTTKGYDDENLMNIYKTDPDYEADEDED